MTNYTLYVRPPRIEADAVMYEREDGATVAFLFTDRGQEYHKFQQWLRDNQDNLPADIQAKVEAGELTIQDADTPE